MLREKDAALTQPVEKDRGATFSRRQVRRLLNLTERNLQSWERLDLVPVQQEYRFSDLLFLKTIARLRTERVSAGKIQQSLHALRERLKDNPELMANVRVFSHGQSVRVQVGRQQMEPISGQLLFDFHEAEISKLLHLPKAGYNSQKAAELLRQKMEADTWFEHGLDLEQRGAPIAEIIHAYQKAADLDPQAAGALVNLGTIYFNGHAWADAEEQYRKALEIDPDYALAHFNLGNLYDERGDQANALEHYKAAIRLIPTYADAHYNIALLYQSNGDMLCAVQHWRAYLKLDGGSKWGAIARRELAKLESAMIVRGQGGRAKVSVLESRKS